VGLSPLRFGDEDSPSDDDGRRQALVSAMEWLVINEPVVEEATMVLDVFARRNRDAAVAPSLRHPSVGPASAFARTGRPGLIVLPLIATLLLSCVAPATQPISGPTGVGNAPPQASGVKRIVVGIRGTPVSPIMKVTVSGGTGQAPGAEELEELVNSRLGMVDPSGTVRPYLAESVPTVENFFHDPAGQRLSVEARTNDGFDFHMKTLYPVADYWQRAGVETSTLVLNRAQAQTPQIRATFPGFEVIRNPTDPTRLVIFHSSQMRLPENNYVGSNYMNYKNAEWDGLLDRFFSTSPNDERTAVLGQIVHMMTDQLLVLGIIYEADPYLIANKVANMGPPHGNVRSPQAWNAYEWDIRT